MYYRGASAAVVVYDITHPSSFERAKKWVSELRQNVTNAGVVIALVGNKADLVDQRAVLETDAREYAADAGLLYFDTSAKDNVNVSELFDTVADKYVVYSLNFKGFVRNNYKLTQIYCLLHCAGSPRPQLPNNQQLVFN